MNKTLKILSVILISIMLLFTIAQPIALAKADPGATLNAVDAVQEGGDTTFATSIGGKIVNWIWGISIVVAVVVLMITGLKFIVGSTQEKAEYKKSLVPLVIGVLILVFATTIVKVLFSIK